MLSLLLLALAAAPLQASAVAAPDLRISELMPSNGTTVTDEDGDTPDWIELHNAGTAPVDLGGYALSDDPEVPQQWVLPSVSLAPDAYLIVWASGKDRTGAELHTSFELAAGGESVVLAGPDGAVLDTYAFGPLPSDVSTGRSALDPDVWQVFDAPTPGAPNGSGFAGITQRPALGVPEGHYSGPVSATASVQDPDATLRYTLDGSAPTLASPELTGAVTFSKSGVLRVRAFRPDWLAGPDAVASYLVGEPQRLPTFALVVEPDDLWDPETGLYVQDNIYDAIEAPVHLAFVDGDRPVFTADAGVRLHGGYARRFAQKSLALLARGRYGAPAFETALFPDLPYAEYEAFVLRNSGHDWYGTMLADGLMQTLVQDADLDYQEYRPTVVYLNGAYWGIHNLREKVNEHYLARRHGVAPDSIDMLEYLWDTPEPLVLHGDADHYAALIDYVGARPTLSDADLAFAEARIDLDNYVDYYAAQIYFNNGDWPGNNNKLWRPRTEDGRWRWILFDTDWGFGYFTDQDYEVNTLARVTDPNGTHPTTLPEATLLLRRLITSEAFQARFANRFADYFNDALAPDRVVAQIDSLADGIEAEIPRHTVRWPESAALWEDSIERMRLFAQERPAYVVTHLREAFGLGELSPVRVRVEGPGRVRVNRLEPTVFPWTGKYFAGTDVPLEAVAAPGWRFDGWSDGVAEATRLVDPGTAPTLAARFVAGEPATTLVINEIQYNPSAALDSEDWVEIHNPTSDTVPLGGWTFSDDDDTHRFAFPDAATLAPGAYLVICRDAAAFAAAYPSATPCEGDWDFGLSGGGDAARLFDSDGALVDSVAFDDEAPWPIEADGDGATLELVASNLDNALAESWAASETLGGTPGASNSVTINDDERPVASALRLDPAFPNPARGSVLLRYALPAPSLVTLGVYDALGREVVRLAETQQDAGEHEVRLHADALPSGVYFVRLGAGAELAVQRLTLVR